MLHLGISVVLISSNSMFEFRISKSCGRDRMIVWIYNYLWNQWQSLLKLWVLILLRLGVHYLIKFLMFPPPIKQTATI